MENIIVAVLVAAFLGFSFWGLRMQQKSTNTFDSDKDEQKTPETTIKESASEKRRK